MLNIFLLQMQNFQDSTGMVIFNFFSYILVLSLIIATKKHNLIKELRHFQSQNEKTMRSRQAGSMDSQKLSDT
jgi:hypothetical protein